MSKLGEVSHEMLGLMHQRVSFQVSGFAVCMGEAAKPLVFEGVKIGGGRSLVRSARFAASPACFASGLWLSSGFAVSLGEAAETLTCLFQGVARSCDVVSRGRC